MAINHAKSVFRIMLLIQLLQCIYFIFLFYNMQRGFFPVYTLKLKKEALVVFQSKITQDREFKVLLFIVKLL